MIKAVHVAAVAAAARRTARLGTRRFIIVAQKATPVQAQHQKGDQAQAQ